MFPAPILTVGWYTSIIHDNFDRELLAAFRDDMIQVAQIDGSEYVRRYSFFDGRTADPGDRIESRIITAPGALVAQRLDVLGVSENAAKQRLDRRLDDYRADAAHERAERDSPRARQEAVALKGL